MGCNFNFYNETTQQESISIQPSKYFLYKNIDRGSKKHLKNVLLAICKLNDWKSTDKISFFCCCNKYVMENEIIKSLYYNDWVYENDNCMWKICPICVKLIN